MLSSRPYRIAICTLAVVAVGGGVGWAGQAAGSVRLVKPITYQGKTIDKGVYKVSIEDATEGPTLVLSTSADEVVASELAIIRDTRGGMAKAHASVSMVTRGGPFVRLAVVSGNKRYLAFFEPAG